MIRLILVLSVLSLVSCKATMMNMALKTFKKDAGKTFPQVWLEDTVGNRAPTDSIFTTEVAFLNMWGTWCSPCLNEIDDLNVLMDRMAHNQDVSFINICARSTREDWLRVVNEKKLQGKNYFISDAEFERMSQQIDSPLEGFPMHLVVSGNCEILGSNLGVSSVEQPITVYVLLQGQKGMHAYQAAKEFLAMASPLNTSQKFDDSNPLINIMKTYFPDSF
ncbi:TlpA family protein disulfide reductase [Parapedobacter defluvii]|nr:thioredoxin-like domain-containing protein [Parapedobacter defluvii]